MAHNVVLKLVDGSIVEKFTCDERSILYSGALKPMANGNVIVASGTVLGGVVVWDLITGEIQHTFTTHEGSIFGLAFFHDGSRLISCSDDRSIRLWDLNTSAQLAVGWGHLARIWGLHFYDNKSIISVSEDCTARIWNIVGDTLETSEVLEGHLGRNVWCGAIHPERILATGGGDGRVRLWDLERKNQFDEHRKQISLEDTQKDISTSLAKGEVFKNYTQINDSMVVTTSEGRVIVLPSTLVFREVKLSDEKVDTYLIVKGWEKANVAAIASRDGLVYLLHLETDKVITLRNELESKLTDILVWDSEGKYYILAQSQNPKDKFIVTRLGFEEGVLTTEQTYKLDPPATFLATSVAMYNVNTLFLGSRHGGIAFYDLLTSTEPSQVWRHVAGSSDSMTSLIVSRNSLHFTTRGGQFGVAVIEKGSTTYTLTIVSLNKLQRGSIEGSIFADSQKLLYGFRNDLFFIWNETKQYELMNEKCGGPHRAWQLTLSESDASHYRLVYTKASKVVLISSDILKNKFSKTLIQDGTHGREIRDISFSPILYDFGRIVATASEDTCVNLATIGTDAVLRNHCTLRKHVSGLQKLKWSEDGTYLYSSAAREEFVVWKVTLTDDGRVYATPVATLPTSSDNPDLRIMNFLVRPLNETLSLIVTVYSDSAIRLWGLDHSSYQFSTLASGAYTTCCILHVDLIVDNSKANLLISATDGHIVSWDVSSILENAGITIDQSLTSEKVIETQADLPDPSFRLALHQSSVKDYIIYPHQGTFYHVSGGDDNSITFAKLNFNTSTAEKIFTISSAHSSTITGVAAVPDNTRRFITSGVDQNVKLWEISPSWNQIELVDEKYTTVADTGALDVALFQQDQVGIIVGGSGLSFWTIKS